MCVSSKKEKNLASTSGFFVRKMFVETYQHDEI